MAVCEPLAAGVRTLAGEECSEENTPSPSSSLPIYCTAAACGCMACWPSIPPPYLLLPAPPQPLSEAGHGFGWAVRVGPPGSVIGLGLMEVLNANTRLRPWDTLEHSRFGHVGSYRPVIDEAGPSGHCRTVHLPMTTVKRRASVLGCYLLRARSRFHVYLACVVFVGGLPDCERTTRTAVRADYCLR